MYVKDTAGTPLQFRLDGLSKARLSWAKAQAPTIKPSGTMIVRRALAHYADHLEEAILDPEKLEYELVQLKAAATGDDGPWKTLPDFASCPGQSLSQWIRHKHQRNIEGLLKSSPFGRMAYKKGAKVK